jgi:plasmid maintenance system antidote protein VapI
LESPNYIRGGFDDQETPEARLAAHASGELLREEILPALDRPKTQIAKLLGVSRQTLNDILAEKQPVHQ